MSGKNHNIISEEERNKLREKAIAQEFYRLTKVLRKKKQVIIFYQITTVFIFLAFCSFFYLNKLEKSPVAINKVLDDTPSQNKSVDLAPNNNFQNSNVQKIVKPVSSISYYTVYFENETDHPLAQFKNKNRLNEFCKILQQMELPSTRTVMDTIYRNRANVSHKNYPHKYAVQLGAYHQDILNQFSDNLIWLNYKHQDQYHKYMIGPFYGYSRSIKFTERINLKDNYILAY